MISIYLLPVSTALCSKCDYTAVYVFDKLAGENGDRQCLTNPKRHDLQQCDQQCYVSRE